MSTPTLTPSTTTRDEFLLENLDDRARFLALAIGGRLVRRPRHRVFFTPGQAERWRALYSAGFHAVRRAGAVGFVRDRRPLPLGVAVAIAREPNIQALPGRASDLGSGDLLGVLPTTEKSPQAKS